MPPGPVQAAAVVALDDDAHVEVQRHRYLARLRTLRDVLVTCGYHTALPDGAFYLWVRCPGGDAWEAARDLARRVGIVVSPGEFYGAAAADHIRLAVVAPDDRIALVASRV
jgi:aspartate/methionine/tyrosine aminotransferase